MNLPQHNVWLYLSAGRSHLYLKTSFAQVQHNSLGGELHRGVATFYSQGQLRRRRATMQFVSSIQMAFRREQECVASQRAWKYARCDLSLLLEDYVVERAAIHRQSDRLPKLRVCQRACTRDLQ